MSASPNPTLNGASANASASADAGAGAESTGIAGKVARRGVNTAIEAARTWAWANPIVPVALTVVAVAAHFLHRHGRRTRVGDALDSTLVTAGPLLDPSPAKTLVPIPTPLAALRHRVVGWLTRGARARRGQG